MMFCCIFVNFVILFLKAQAVTSFWSRFERRSERSMLRLLEFGPFSIVDIQHADLRTCAPYEAMSTSRSSGDLEKNIGALMDPEGINS